MCPAPKFCYEYHFWVHQYYDVGGIRIARRIYEDVKAYLDTLAEEDPEAYRKATADGWSFLALNDNIITSGNELYEGKVIG